MRDDTVYTVGKMGYDTKPFAERASRAAELMKKERLKAIKEIPIKAPFIKKGLFRTKRPDQYWNAAFGEHVCAVELFTGDEAATYLYRFREPRQVFLEKLEEAMEAMSIHREIIYLTDEQLREKSLYKMSVDRMEALRFLRERSDGRMIHNADHARNLENYIHQA